MHSFSFLKAFCMDTAVNCLPFFKKPHNASHESYENPETNIWSNNEENQKLKNEGWIDVNSKPPIELNTIFNNSVIESTNNTFENNKMIGNINEDSLKNEV